MTYMAMVVGMIAIVIGIVGNSFTAADEFGGGAGDNTELPLWLGRLLFIGIGAIFFVCGLVGISK